MSLAVDTINELLFDLVGDTVIAFDGDEPYLVEDYAEDVREALS
ncbi:MAG: tellurite resistance TerB C-terminal domain-containing protein [Olsenella profusa]